MSVPFLISPSPVLSSLSALYGFDQLACEVHAVQTDMGELREGCDVVRDRAAEPVVAEVETLERRRERFEHPQRLVE